MAFFAFAFVSCLSVVVIGVGGLLDIDIMVTEMASMAWCKRKRDWKQ